MGKTLAKQRKKEAKLAQENSKNGGPTAGGVLAAIAKRLKYKLPNLANAKKKVKLVPIISEAMNARAWEDAAQLLEMLEKQQGEGQAEVPKLGAIMRWVRAADLAGTEAVAAKLLAGIMRVAAGPQPAAPAAGGVSAGNGNGASTSAEAGADGVATGGGAIPVRRFPPWRPPPAAGTAEDGEAASAGTGTSTSAAAVTSNGATPNARTVASITAARAKFGSYAGRFGVVPLPAEYAGTNANGSTMTNAAAAAAAAAAQDGAATLLPNVAKDLTMFCTEPDTVQWEQERPPATRVEVPFVTGAFVLVGALSREECAQIMACAEEMGYTVDPDYTFSAAARAAAAGSGLSGASSSSSSSSSSAARNGGSGGGERGAAGCVWLADESLQGPLYGRISHLLPQRLCGGDLAGINCRWRLYRYDKGAVYRPHVDGAWPGSGLKDGRYEFDAYGDRWSRLTFLVYLNDDFEGGATTFYTPAQPGSGACLEAHSVRPVAGNILVFPHGDTMGSLVHEGAAVTQGAKYVIRTEVLYKLEKSATGGWVGAPQPAIQMPAANGATGTQEKRQQKQQPAQGRALK